MITCRNIPFLSVSQNPGTGRIQANKRAGKKTSPIKYKDYCGGFRHPGEPPAEQTSVWETIQTAPNYRRYIHIIVEAPNGDYAAYCGMCVRPENRYGYVEPVATDPNYRRLRLGRTAVLEEFGGAGY